MSHQKSLITVQYGSESIVFELEADGRYIVGRESKNAESDITLPATWANVSRRHCAINIDRGEVMIADLGSSNGTYINGESLRANEFMPIGNDELINLGPGAEAVRLILSPSPARDKTLFELMATSDEIIIGRGSGCGYVIRDPSASRRHARIFRKNQRLYVEDLGSSNGTFINKRRISKPTVMNDADELSIGFFTLRLRVEAVDSQSEPVIVAAGISKIFENGRVGLHPTDFFLDAPALVAIMGPSGSGKTTFLKLLNGETSASSGEIKVYGYSLDDCRDFLGNQIGYVPQEDIVHRQLSVRNTLRFAARIRLPPGRDQDQVDEEILEILSYLGLDENEIQNTHVGNLSGGQRKRVSIAVELLGRPKLLFLDEPTSPLDPESVKDFLDCLKGLNAQGTTVLLVTHKPQDLESMDRVEFVGTGGYRVYSGHPDGLIQKLGEKTIVDVYSKFSRGESARQWYSPPSSEMKGNSNATSRSQSQLHETFYFDQLYWQSRRYLALKLADKRNLALTLVQPIAIGLLIRLTFPSLRVDGGVISSLLFLVALSTVWFGVVLSAKELVSERPVYLSERRKNLSPFVYILSKQTVLSMFLIAQLGIFLGLLKAFYGDDLISASGTFIFLFILGNSAIVFGLALSAFAKTEEWVMSVLPLALMPQVILAGVISPISNWGTELTSYLTLGRWGTEGLARLQTTDGELPRDLTSHLYSADANLFGRTADSLEGNQFMLVLISLVLVFVVYVCVRSLDKRS